MNITIKLRQKDVATFQVNLGDTIFHVWNKIREFPSLRGASQQYILSYGDKALEEGQRSLRDYGIKEPSNKGPVTLTLS